MFSRSEFDSRKPDDSCAAFGVREGSFLDVEGAKVVAAGALDSVRRTNCTEGATGIGAAPSSGDEPFLSPEVPEGFFFTTGTSGAAASTA